MPVPTPTSSTRPPMALTRATAMSRPHSVGPQNTAS